MSSWHYQIMRHVDDGGETYLAVHELYSMDEGKEGWTKEPITIVGETVPEIRMALLNALRDLERHGVRDFATGAKVDG